jgi:hypothetical protein
MHAWHLPTMRRKKTAMNCDHFARQPKAAAGTAMLPWSARKMEYWQEPDVSHTLLS